MTASTSRLPSGPSVPPLHSALPAGLVVRKWPCAGNPLSGGAVEVGLRPIPCEMTADWPTMPIR